MGKIQRNQIGKENGVIHHKRREDEVINFMEK